MAEPCPHTDAGAHFGYCSTHSDCEPGSDPDTCAVTLLFANTYSDRYYATAHTPKRPVDADDRTPRLDPPVR